MAETIWWTGFCGNRSLYDAFWSPALSLNTSTPDLTLCMQRSVIFWIPVIWIWMSAPLAIWDYLQAPRHHRKLQFGKLSLAKVVLGAVMIIMALISLGMVLSKTSRGSPTPPVDVLFVVLRFFTMILITSLMRLEFLRGCVSSSTLCIFWVFYFVISIVSLRSVLMVGNNMEAEDDLSPGFELVQSVLVMFQFVLSLFGDSAAIIGDRYEETEEEEEKTPLLQPSKLTISKSSNPVPELKAGFWMRSFYVWILPSMFRAYRKPVEFEELYDVRPQDSCSTTLPIYYKKFNEIAKVDENGHITNIRWAFYRAIFEAVGWPIFWSQFAKPISTGLFLLSPQLLRLMLSYMKSGDPYLWKAVFLAFSIFLSSWLGSLVRHNFYNTGWNAGMQARSVVNALVTRKALRLAGTSGKMTTVGEMVNYLSVDAQRIQDMYTFGHFLVELPIQVVFTITFLWLLFGWTTISGMILFGLLLLINGAYLGKKITFHQLELMVYKDRRLKIINEILNGIKILKLYAWEPSYHSQISKERKAEVKYIRYINLISCFSTAIWSITPYLLSASIFILYTLVSDTHVLSAEIAFVGLSYMNTVTFILGRVPLAIAGVGQGIVSSDRIAKFLALEELDDNSVTRDMSYSDKCDRIEIENGNFAWASEEVEVLKDINMRVKPGELVAVVGNVGAGKSSLLSAMLGELVRKSGEVKINGNVAYVPQQAWIQNATVKDNIVFGKTFDKSKYRQAINACALSHDLEVLPGGDNTEIGEKGINLSGGQKQRVSLARSVYQDEDIYLFDDPLSAVDAHVGKHIFEKVIGKKGVLKDKTRILATHAITFLPYVDKIIVLRNGRISEEGQYDILIQNDGDFAEFVRTYLIEQEVNEDSAPELWNLHQRLSASSATESASSSKDLPRQRRKRKSKGDGMSPSVICSMAETNMPHKKSQLIHEETSEEGRLKFNVIWTFIKAGGIFQFVIIIAAQIMFVISTVSTNLWLSKWTAAIPVNGSIPYNEVTVWAGVYGAFGIAQVVSVLILVGATAVGCTKASEEMHSTLLYHILRAPMAFFDTTPLGRIINRFSKEMDMLDANSPVYLRNWLLALSPLISSLVIISYSTPIFLIIIGVMIFLFGITQRVYITFASQLKRLDSVRRSPIYAHFDETVSGASSIRAYQRQQEFIDKADYLIDGSQRPFFMLSAIQRWLAITLESFAAIICFFASLFTAMSRDQIGPGLAGAAISYSFQVTMVVNTLVRSATELETNMVSVERIDEYSKTKSEAEWSLPSDNDLRLKKWPREGAVTFKNYGTRYRDGLDLVLKDVNLKIKARSKVGVVGRTGAGKSSLTLALFRIIEAAQGSILIDGEDVSKFGLHKLRSNLTVIPQDPVMFSGPLRQNLDPFGSYTDDAIWTALERAHLKPFASSLEEGLDYNCGEGGDALSVGQRQLVCLARALLRQTKILILDEATAAVDLETDALIQESIRINFIDSTVITVAHRINTVLDYDRILVLDQGRIKEYDSPSNLLQDKTSTFYSLAKEAGLAQ